MAARPIHVLLVEGDPADAELLLRELRRGGLEFTWTVVACESAYRAALGDAPDIVLGDFSLPDLDSSRALAILRLRHRQQLA